MADKPGPTPPVGPEASEFKLSESPNFHAPFLYFDQASAFGHHDGIVRITLEAVAMIPNASGVGVKIDRVMVTHLRMSLAAARSLKEAVDAALLLAAPISDARN